MLGTYALMQNYGKDFVKWNNPYNKILGTLGNPNFASASMAIIACLCFASLFVKEFNLLFRLANSLLFILLMFDVYSSDSRQGLVAFSVGAGVMIVVQLKNKSSSLGLIGLILFILSGVLSILGMLQIGPLTDLLYKGSVTVRGYYWRAGFDMFQNNPLFGVGIDRYGAYFKEYRDKNYALTYGFDITSSNAHNTFIQLFATGGLFVGLLYVLINIYILVCGIKTILKIRNDLKIIFTGLFSAWLVYLAQTFISIDNIGVTIWGWLLGGTIIALSVNAPTTIESQKTSSTTDVNNRNLNSKSVSLQPIFSGVFTLIAIVFVSFLYRGEVIPMQAISFYNSTSPTESSPKHFEMAQKIFNMNLIDPNYKFDSAKRVAMTGKKDEALSQLNSLNKYDSRNLEYLLAISALSENMTDYKFAILKRNEITKLDPWNAKNYLELGRDYKLIGEFTEMERCKKIILEFATNTPEASIALTELVS
jgi:tetratricopeptide (TPR) repeat protein